MSHDQDEDAALVQEIARKNQQAFREFYYRYSPRIGKYLVRLLGRHELVDEAVNDAMMVVWTNAAQYDPASSKVSTWLFGIARNKGLKVLARTARHSTHEEDLEADFANGDKADPTQAVLAREFGHVLQSALGKLSAEHRDVLGLTFGEHYSYQDIAEITGCPVNTVKTRVFHARKRLRALLEEVGYTPRSLMMGEF